MSADIPYTNKSLSEKEMTLFLSNLEEILPRLNSQAIALDFDE
jgi:hypothetical protein